MSRPVLLALIALGGTLAWMLYKHGGPPGLTFAGQLGMIGIAAIIAIVSLIPPVRLTLEKWTTQIRHPSRQTRAWTAVGVWLLAAAYLGVTAHQQHRDLYPRLHDECSYTIQARMLSEGMLWRPQHEVGDFFETFHFLTRPVYASIYFPGAALMNVPGIWLQEPSWVMPVIFAALAVAFSYLVATELVDGVAGLVVALLVLSTCLFRTYSTMVMAQIPTLFLGLLLAWSFLHWRREKKLAWSVAMGAFAGWAAITRPVDALAFAIPIGIAVLLELRRESRRAWTRTIVALLLGAFPFLELQVVFDWNVTGKPWKTPYVMYLEQNQPGSVFGSGTDEMARSQSQLPQKQIYFGQLAIGEQLNRAAGIGRWIDNRLRMTSSATLPCAILLAFIPAGLLIARERGRWIILAAVPLYLALYALNPFYLLHYAVPLTAAVAMAAVFGARAIERAFGSPIYRRFTGAFCTAALVLLAVGSLPQFNRQVTDEQYRTPFLDYAQRALAQVPAPAVVLFRFDPRCNVHEEPVYNMDVTWPDDAPIIRAQDLGPRRDGELLSYYASRQPERNYFLFDRWSGRVIPLGNAAQAAKALHVEINLPAEATADAR